MANCEKQQIIEDRHIAEAESEGQDSSEREDRHTAESEDLYTTDNWLKVCCIFFPSHCLTIINSLHIYDALAERYTYNDALDVPLFSYVPIFIFAGITVKGCDSERMPTNSA